MGLEFLARVRSATLGLGGLAALMIASYVGPRHGLAIAAGAAWSLVNLWLIERLIVAITGPERASLPSMKRAALATGGMLPLFAAGAFLVTRLPIAYLVVGFVAPFAVMVLKAASVILLGSRAWKALVASPWRAATAVAVLVAVAYLAVGAAAQDPHGQTTSDPHGQTTSDPHPVPGDHAPAPTEHGTTTQETQHAEGEAHGGGHASEGPQKFANVITVLSRAFPDAGWARFLHHFEAVIFALFIALLLCIVAFMATRNPQMVPGSLQNGAEMVVEALRDFVVGILGEKHGMRYVPFLGTLFVYIMTMNLFGLIPFMDSPTSSLNITVALALTVFVFSQYIGFKELGVLGYLDHMAGSPRTPISWGLVPIMLPIHVLGELAKPISLACRLFGNVFGEDMLLVAFASLGVTTLAFTGMPFGLPLQLPFLFLALLTGTLQALVFTVLSTIYFLLMLPHDDHGHEGEVQHAHP